MVPRTEVMTDLMLGGCSGTSKGGYHSRVSGRLSDLARVFLKLGVISFGGPAAHVALMRGECVTRRRWLTDQAFLALVGATNILPGPNSTEVAIPIGRLRPGVPGLLVAGACFILPAMAIVLAFAIGYVRYGTL